MSHWIFCCPEQCPVMSDDFHRANSSDLGIKWVEVTPDADIEGQKLRLAGGARVISVASHVSDPFLLRVSLTDDDGGPVIPDLIYRIIFHYKDEQNFGWVTFITTENLPDGPESTTIQFGQVIGGSSTTFVTNSISQFIDEIQLDLCFNRNGLYVLHELFPDLYTCMTPTGGRRAGLDNPNASGAIYWDDFSLSNHKLPVPNKGCAKCTCDCWHYCVSKQLIATVIATSGDPEDPEFCSCWNGVTADLDYNHTGSEFAWTGTLILPSHFDGCPGPDPQDTELTLICGGAAGRQTDWQGWTLCMEGELVSCNVTPGGCGAGDEGFLQSPSDGNCAGFFLSFGPENCESESGICLFTIIVTER